MRDALKSGWITRRWLRPAPPVDGPELDEVGCARPDAAVTWPHPSLVIARF